MLTFFVLGFFVVETYNAELTSYLTRYYPTNCLPGHTFYPPLLFLKQSTNQYYVFQKAIF